jgi:hypothetical protein
MKRSWCCKLNKGAKNMDKEQHIEQIAKKHLMIETLEPRNSDSSDFHDCAVWSIKAALEAAYEAGRQAIK